MKDLKEDKRQDRQDNRALKTQIKEDAKQTKQSFKQAKQDVKFYDKIESEAGKYGLDLKNLPTGPMTQEAKEKINLGVKQTVSDEQAKDIKGFSEAYGTPKYTDRPTLDKEKLQQDYKKQRRQRIFDAIGALGQGMQGKTVDTSKFASKQTEKARDEQYKNYRDVVSSNKARAEQWEGKYRDDLLNFLDGKLKDKNTSALEKTKLEALKADIANRKAGTAKVKASTPKQGAAKLPVYTYDDKEGNKVSIPIPDRKTALQFVEQREKSATLSDERQILQDQMDQELADAWEWTGGKEKVRAKYEEQLALLDTQINELNTSMRGLAMGGDSEITPAPSSDEPTPTKAGGIMNKYRK